MRAAVSQVLAEAALDGIVTIGPDGYDGHPDHIATFHASQAVAEESEQYKLWALDGAHSGNLVMAGGPERKLGALAHHRSQTTITTAGPYWHNSVYAPLFRQETYLQ